MSYNPNTKTINAPVSVYDVQQALSTGDHDVGTLCVNTGINSWAKCKPISAPNIVRALDYSIAEQVTNYHCGLSVVSDTRDFNYFFQAVRASLTNPAYKRNNVYTAVKYDKPTGTILSPYRLSDFDGYRHDAYLDAIINDGSQDPSISPVYSQAIQIDLRGTVENKPLPNDSTKLAYYVDHMSSTSQIAARPNLHILDIIQWQLSTGVVLSNLRRGMLIMRADSTSTYKWATGTIPWASDPDWSSTFGSASGTSVWVIEFYTTANYAGGTENRTGQFFCIPEFSYVTKCITNANFAGSYPECNPNTNMIGVIYSCDAPVSTFDELFIDLEIEYQSGTWDRINPPTITVKNYAGTNVQSTYENILSIDSTNRGKNMRIRIYGKLSGSANTTTFYYSEEVVIN